MRFRGMRRQKCNNNIHASIYFKNIMQSISNKNSNFRDILAQQVNELPNTYVKSILSDKSDKLIRGFLDRENLTEDQKNLVKRDIVMLLLGIESYEKFPDVLADDYNLSKDTALAIREFINTELYKKIVNGMTKKGVGVDTLPVPAPPASSNTYTGKTDPYREPAN